MNRRQFCFRILTCGACAELTLRCASAELAMAAIPKDGYAVLSALIPILQPQSGHGYMMASSTAVADALPCIQETLKSAIDQAKDASAVTASPYETSVPEQYRLQFSQALAFADAHRIETAYIHRSLQLNKPYRLLTEEQLQEYSALSPPVISPEWKRDTKVAKEYNGWGSVSYVSVPYFDQTRTFAMVWTHTPQGCSRQGWYFLNRSGDGWEQLHWKTDIKVTCY